MSERALILVGAGGHASVVADALLRAGLHIQGIIDQTQPTDTAIFGTVVLGNDAWLELQNPAGLALVNGIGAASSTHLRSSYFQARRNEGFLFAGVRHPASVVSTSAQLGEGSQIMAGAVVQSRAEIGMNVVINTRASVDHDCRVGANSFIGPGATLCGNVTIGEGVFVGAQAVVLPGLHVGAACVVGAGSVVVRDVPAGERVAGNPATRLTR